MPLNFGSFLNRQLVWFENSNKKYLSMNILNFIFVLGGLSSVTAFSWQTCGATTDPVKILSLTQNSKSNETFYFSGKGKVAYNITAPIQAKFEVRKKFFWGWLDIPCINNFGSCKFQDLCSFSPYIGKKCPEEFISNNLPCACPILQGQYTAKQFPIDISFFPHWIESGIYKIKMELSHTGQELLCLIINISL